MATLRWGMVCDTFVGSGIENVSIIKLCYLILFVTPEHKKGVVTLAARPDHHL